MLFDFKCLLTKFPTPSYLENIDLGVIAKEMVEIKTLTTNQWKMIKKLQQVLKKVMPRMMESNGNQNPR